METLALISSPRLQWRSSPPLSRPILNSASPFVVSTSNKTHVVVVQTRDFSRESCSRGARNPSGKISINVLEKSGLEAFARISSSSEENSSVAVNTQKFVQLPPSRIGSPFFWIGVLVGISALIYWTKAVVKPKQKPLRIMISGAPASGKGTQCELITKKYGLVHIAAGDLLRAEVAAGSENGKRAKEYMEKGQLVPNEIVVMMVKDRLLQPDAQENGWLLDGYPRSYSQAKALEDLGIRPDLFILLDVPEEILVERVVGRRLDPVTGKIYHLKYSPPENEEIASRLTQRFDDTEEKVKLRLHTHHQNVEDVLSIYKDLTLKINGNIPKEDVFAQIDNALTGLLDQKKATPASEAISR